MSEYFVQRTEVRKGVQCHRTLRLRGENAEPSGPGGHLRSRGAVAALRNEHLPAFMVSAGLDNLQKAGFRLAVDIPQQDSPTVHLMAGPAAAQCPQDWLSPFAMWRPKQPDDKPSFFDLCADAAKRRAETMKFGNTMLYVPGVTDVFGVTDGDPKAETHFLVLATDVFGNIMDQGFTADHLNKFFEVAYKLCQQLGIIDQHIRLIANAGTGFQQGPRVHVHVLSASGRLPSMFPCDYGNFSIQPDGTIAHPSPSAGEQELLRLIAERKSVSGFDATAKQQKFRIDALISQQLAVLDQRIQ